MNGGSLDSQYINQSELDQHTSCTFDDCGSGKLPLKERAGILKQGNSNLCNQYPGMPVKVILIPNMTFVLE